MEEDLGSEVKMRLRNGGIAIRISLILALCLLFMFAYAGDAVLRDVPVEKYAGIAISQKVINTTGSSGENVNYSIKIKNMGEIELKNVEVIDIMPGGIKYMYSKYNNSDEKFFSRFLDIGDNGETKSITWNLGSLGTNQEKEIVLFVTKTRTDEAASDSLVSATGQALNIPVSNQEMIFVDQLYDLGNSRIILNETLLPMYTSTNVTEIDYFILVKNIGAFPLNEVWINDTFPARMVYVNSGFYDPYTLNLTTNLTPEDMVQDDEGYTEKVLLKLISLDAGAEKHIKLTVRHKADEQMEEKYKLNVVEVSGLALGEMYKMDINREAKETVEK